MTIPRHDRTLDTATILSLRVHERHPPSALPCRTAARVGPKSGLIGAALSNCCEGGPEKRPHRPYPVEPVRGWARWVCSGGPMVGPPGKEFVTREIIFVFLYCPATDRRGSGFAFSLTCGYRVRPMEGKYFHQAQKTAKTLQMEQIFFHQEHPERLILHNRT